ncbi:MAG: hypothetical protein M3541_00280 [Acidobacteriota bacterium]|nr:hypothetical protein [Acidobacteriota bacterium]MDQ3417220.1 hypothetical protein [Acidobacteriota bacterium]
MTSTTSTSTIATTLRTPIFLGVSLMDVVPIDGGFRVRCPGCRAERILGPAAEVSEFTHSEIACAVRLRIEAARWAFEVLL